LAIIVEGELKSQVLNWPIDRYILLDGYKFFTLQGEFNRKNCRGNCSSTHPE